MKNLYKDVDSPEIEVSDADYEIIVKENPFSFIIKRKSTKEEILNTEG